MRDNFWESRYATADRIFGDEPSELLTRFQHLFSPGMTALAVGDGEGRNSVWLARQGLQVTAVEQSRCAVEKAQLFAIENQVHVDFQCMNLHDYAWPNAAFDLVISIFVHLPPADRERARPRLINSLRTGGLLVIEGYHVDHLTTRLSGPPDPQMYFTETGVTDDYSGLAILHLQKGQTDVIENGVILGKGIALEYIGRKAST